MEGDIDKKLKEVLKSDKKKKGKKVADLKVKVGIYAGRRGPYKLFKIKDGEVVAVRTRKNIKGGSTEEDISKVEFDDKLYKLPDLDDHLFDEADESMIKEEITDKKIEELEKAPKTVKVVELKPEKKRVQTAKQKEWMDYVARIAMLPEMAGKSRAFVMQEAAKRRKAQ